MPWRKIVAGTQPTDYNILQHPQMLRTEFDYFQTWATNTQQVATYSNRVAKRPRDVAPNNVTLNCSNRLAGALGPVSEERELPTTHTFPPVFFVVFTWQPELRG